MNPPECTPRAVISFFGLLEHNSMQTYWFTHELSNHTLNEEEKLSGLCNIIMFSSIDGCY